MSGRRQLPRQFFADKESNCSQRRDLLYSGILLLRAENILIAATAKGYATTWIEGQLHHNGEDRKMAQLLGVPEDLNVAVYLPIGIPDSAVPAPKKMAFEERAWFNGYGG